MAEKLDPSIFNSVDVELPGSTGLTRSGRKGTNPGTLAGPTKYNRKRPVMHHRRDSCGFRMHDDLGPPFVSIVEMLIGLGCLV